MPERRLATCQPFSEHSLIAAPPVEKSSAADRTISRSASRGWGCSVIGEHHTYDDFEFRISNLHPNLPGAV